MLTGVGVSFNVRWPPFYRQMLTWLSTIELDLPATMPLSCILPVNFHASLVMQTGGPLVLVGALSLTSFILHRVGMRSDKKRKTLRASAIPTESASTVK